MAGKLFPPSPILAKDLFSINWLTFYSLSSTLADTADLREKSMEDDGQLVEPVNPNLPIRQYLDQNIMPSLLEALEKLTQDKPEDPIQYIGEYLLKQDDNAHAKWNQATNSYKLYSISQQHYGDRRGALRRLG